MITEDEKMAQERVFGSTLMSSFIDRGIDGIDLSDDPQYRVEVDNEGHADIMWTEYLGFHQRLADGDHAKFGNAPAWSQFVDEFGFLTAENETKLVAELVKLTSVADIETVEYGGDEPCVTFSVRTDYLQGETVDQWFDRIGWHVVATLTNATDPGTFNFPYLFSAILYH
jgi:hypothetical protein